MTNARQWQNGQGWSWDDGRNAEWDVVRPDGSREEWVAVRRDHNWGGPTHVGRGSSWHEAVTRSTETQEWQDWQERNY